MGKFFHRRQPAERKPSTSILFQTQTSTGIISVFFPFQSEFRAAPDRCSDRNTNRIRYSRIRFFDRMQLHFHCRTVFQERSFVRRKLLPHRKLHSSAAFRRLCCAHFPKQRFKPALTYPISVTALSPFEYTGAVSELFSAISRPLRFRVVRSAADCINDSGGIL